MGENHYFFYVFGVVWLASASSYTNSFIKTNFIVFNEHTKTVPFRNIPKQDTMARESGKPNRIIKYKATMMIATSSVEAKIRTIS